MVIMSSQWCSRLGVLSGCLLLSARLASAQLLPPTVAKAFSPSYTTPGAAVTLTITLGNPNSSALSFVFVYDTLPAGVNPILETLAFVVVLRFFQGDSSLLRRTHLRRTPPVKLVSRSRPLTREFL